MNSLVFQPRYLISFALVALLIAYNAVNSSRTSSPAPAVKEVSAAQAQALMAAGAVVIDVRDKAVSSRAHLPGALLIPFEVLEARMGNLQAAKTANIVVYCGDGSTLGPDATRLLNGLGYANAVNLKPGFQGWAAAGLPTASG